jgi:hypothetical protein
MCFGFFFFFESSSGRPLAAAGCVESVLECSVGGVVESAASCRKCGVVVESAASLSKVQRRCLKCGVVAHSEFLSATRDSLFYYGAFFFPDNNNVDK